MTDTTFTAVGERSPLPVLLEFKSRTCPHSQRVQPLIERMARDSWDRLRVATLDINENQATSARFRVNATPTFLVLDRGRELDRIEGAVSEDQLRYRLHRYLTI
ncbi:MAG: thioredoxin family protein [Thermoleophilia bacterium]